MDNQEMIEAARAITRAHNEAKLALTSLRDLLDKLNYGYEFETTDAGAYRRADEILEFAARIKIELQHRIGANLVAE